MPLTGKTQVFGIIGDPVAHSLSPLMHNHAFELCPLDAVYVPFKVPSADLKSAVLGLRALNVSGFNVTVPHKEKIIPLLDEVDDYARLIGAVNTVVNKQGLLTGYNTDASGFLRSAKADLNFVPKNSSVLLLGTGGACRAALAALAAAQVKSLAVAGRNIHKVGTLIDQFSDQFPHVEWIPLDYQSRHYLECVSMADMIVNTTPVGLKSEKINFLPLENIKGSALIYDMIYSLSETPLIKATRQLNLRSCDGLGMLAAQGEEAFFLWTGIRLEPDLMKRYLQEFCAKSN